MNADALSCKNMLAKQPSMMTPNLTPVLNLIKAKNDRHNCPSINWAQSLAFKCHANPEIQH